MIAAFGAAGAVCRFLVGLACVRLLGGHFAYGTLVVNVVGCFLLGVLLHLATSDEWRLAPHTHAGMTIGFLGALTTFSTFGLETVRHAHEGDWHLAALNVAANVVLGLLGAAGGLAIGKAWV